MSCINLKIKTKKGRRFLYCNLLKKEITFDNCKDCANKEYKKVKCTINRKNCAKKSTLSKKSPLIGGHKHKLTKATDIPMSVKKKVFERDKGCCVVCGNSVNVMPNAHYIRRSKNGLGIEQNIFTACTDLTENKCHSNFDKYGIGKDKVIANFKKHYSEWNEDKLVYKKH